MKSRNFPFLATALLVGASLASTASTAHAQAPPPPTYWGLRISNTTGADVDDVVIKIWPTKEMDTAQTHWVQFDYPVTYTFERIPNGRTFEISLTDTSALGYASVSKMTVTANCPGPLAAELMLQEPAGDRDGDVKQERAGFTPNLPTGETFPLLRFLAGATMNDPARAMLSGTARWGNFTHAGTAGPVNFTTTHQPPPHGPGHPPGHSPHDDSPRQK